MIEPLLSHNETMRTNTVAFGWHHPCSYSLCTQKLFTEVFMNWGKRILTIAALFGVFASGMVGCSKNSGDSNIMGDVAVNGTTASKTDTVSGMPVSLTISTASSYGGYGGYGYGSQTVTINNYPISLQPVLAQNYYTTGPTAYNLGQYNVLVAAICPDQTCTNMAIVVWAQPAYSMYGQTGQFNAQMPAMQMGVYKDQAGTIHSALEKVGYPIVGTTAYGSPALSTAVDVMTWLVQNTK
jgi:hypothetical protein